MKRPSKFVRLPLIQLRTVDVKFYSWVRHFGVAEHAVADVMEVSIYQTRHIYVIQIVVNGMDMDSWHQITE